MAEAIGKASWDFKVYLPWRRKTYSINDYSTKITGGEGAKEDDKRRKHFHEINDFVQKLNQTKENILGKEKIFS